MPVIERITCPHCKTLVVPQHPARCPDNPDMHARLLAVLADSDRPGYAISSSRYGLLAARLQLPAEITLKKHYGSWLETVTAFGLQMATVGRKATGRKPRQSRQNARRQVVAPCPYCNRNFSELFVHKHMRYCVQRPGMAERMRELVEDTPGCGYGVDMSEYRRRLDAWRETKPAGVEALPSVPTIKDHFREWRQVLHWLGLLSEDEVIDARTAADNARYRAAWQEQHRRELDARGVFIGDDDPREPNYKPPIIHTDRVPPGYQRVMLR